MAGSEVYVVAMVQSKYLLYCSRFFTGLFNGFNLAPMYISLTVGTRRRAEVSFYFSAAMTPSLAVGPALASALNFMMLNVFTSHNAAWNARTAPGYLMALVYVFFMSKVSACFQNLPVDVTAPPTPAPEEQRRRCNGLPLIVTCASTWYLCATGMAMAGSEVYVVAMVQSHMRLSVTDSGLLAALLYFCSGVANLIVGRYLTPLMKSDRAGLVIASFLACVGCLPLYILSVGRSHSFADVACLCIALILTFGAIIRAYALSVSSKLVAPHAKALMVTVGTIGAAIGRGVGPIYGAVLDDVSFALVTGGLFAATLLISTVTYTSMRYETPVAEK